MAHLDLILHRAGKLNNMAKKDGEIELDVTRNGDARNVPLEQEQKKEPEDGHTEVKNAHAAGLGAMGRSEQKIDKPGDEQGTY